MFNYLKYSIGIILINFFQCFLTTKAVMNRTIKCPLKCICHGIKYFEIIIISDQKSIECNNLNQIELFQLFDKNSKFLNDFSKNLQNFTLKNSQLKDLSIFPMQFNQLLFLGKFFRTKYFG